VGLLTRVGEDVIVVDEAAKFDSVRAQQPIGSIQENLGEYPRGMAADRQPEGDFARHQLRENQQNAPHNLSVVGSVIQRVLKSMVVDARVEVRDVGRYDNLSLFGFVKRRTLKTGPPQIGVEECGSLA
jgi:hypothetical protein